MSPRHLVMFVALAAIWGSSFMFVEIALRDFTPLSVSAARTAIAGIALAAIAFVPRSRRESAAVVRRRAPRLAVMGSVGVAVPLLLVAWGQQYVDSGFAAILNASTPLWAAVLALLFVRAEAVTGIRLAGFVLGFGGVIVLVGAGPEGGRDAVLGSLAVVASAACYAVGALYAARRLADVPSTLVSLGAMGSAGVFLLIPGLLDGARGGIGWAAAAAVLMLGLGNGTLAVLFYFALIAGAGATPTMLSAYLVPVTALILGVGLLDEPLTASAVVGMVLILAGVALGTGTVRRRAPVTPPA